MTKFLVNIWAYDFHGKFEVESEDNPTSLENAIVDKLGENDIMWERTGMFSRLNRITYEEVTYDTRPIQTKKVLGVEVGTGASGSNNRYTLEMVRIDDKVKQVITEIKLEEAAIAHRQNTVEGAAPQVSVAT